jgi:hypothetical protein
MDIKQKIITNNIELSDLLDIRAKISKFKDIWYLDVAVDGIFGRPTVYMWTYKNAQKSTEKNINKMFPDLFCIYDISNKNIPELNKLVLLIHEMNETKPDPEPDPSTKRRYKLC